MDKTWTNSLETNSKNAKTPEEMPILKGKIESSSLQALLFMGFSLSV